MSYTPKRNYGYLTRYAHCVSSIVLSSAILLLESLPLSLASLKHLIFLSNFYNLQVYGGNFYSFSRELSSFIDIVTCLQQASIFEMDFVPLSLTLLREEHIYSILYEIYWFIMQIASANAYFFCLFLSSSPSPFSSISLLWNSFCLCVNSDLFFSLPLLSFARFFLWVSV